MRRLTYQRLFSGNGLIFVGASDAMWQAEEAVRNPTRHNPHVFPEARHLCAEDITALGDTVEGNRAAKLESDRILLERLKEWHSTPARGSLLPQHVHSPGVPAPPTSHHALEL